jgi:hypothetical protein
MSGLVIGPMRRLAGPKVAGSVPALPAVVAASEHHARLRARYSRGLLSVARTQSDNVRTREASRTLCGLTETNFVGASA